MSNPGHLAFRASLETADRRRYLLNPVDATLIGRQGCGICLPDPSVAPQHARLRPSATGFVVESVGGSVSINGGIIGGPTPIKSGDAIGLGATILTYHGAESGTAASSGNSQAKQSVSYEALFEKLRECVVGINVESNLGSGFFLHPTGLIVTNRHVVGYARNAAIHLADGTQKEGRVVRAFREPDLAFLRVDFAPRAVAQLAPVGSARVGQTVLVIGHPMGLANTLTRGIISAVDREIQGRRLLQTDAAINPGNSGGPLFNEVGQVVGVATMGLGHSQGLNFAVQAEEVQQRMAHVFADERRAKDGTYCPICSGWGPVGNYCQTCGAALELPGQVVPAASSVPVAKPAACPGCGREIHDGDKFCSGCGKLLS